jgi:poly(A) polymerase
MKENKEALFIINTLKKRGYVAYFAGGAPRDILLKRPIDDIDIATNASPKVIRSLFKKTVPIGIAFGIILVIINDKKFEVATFRKDIGYLDGRHPAKITFATAEEDAQRRDFTINGMFYDPIEKKILDFVNGKKDLKKGIIKAIGNAEERIKEDRLRMIRAIRFATRFNFKIEDKTKKAICLYASDLFPHVAIERIWQELTKMHMTNTLQTSFILLHELGLLGTIFEGLQNISLEELKKRQIPTYKFPQKTPLILHVVVLFKDLSLKEAEILCKKLKLSNQDAKVIELFYKAQDLLKTKAEDHLWADFFTHEEADMLLEVLGCINKKIILKTYLGKKEHLKKFILRLQRKDPVVKADHLEKHGISPGRTMGLLLKEASKISINESLEHAAPIIDRLKKSPLWPK